ncbi:MAG TPA: hypothetical protein VEN82_01485, partial [Actinomycetota bacterium]|nr:hypothetical protein [Actinomycetota bacterium]
MDRTALRTERADALTGAVPFVLACLAVVLFYSAPFGLRGFKVPVADDTFFYVGAIRAVARLGLADPRIGARPAFPLLGAVLGSVTRSGPWVAALALPVAMAAAFGLAGAALAARWGLRGRGLALFCGLVSLSAVAARLVAGKADNLMTLWMIAALLAVGAWVGGSRGRVAVAAL